MALTVQAQHIMPYNIHAVQQKNCQRSNICLTQLGAEPLPSLCHDPRSHTSGIT